MRRSHHSHAGRAIPRARKRADRPVLSGRPARPRRSAARREEVGGLDEALFAYMEDFDLAPRIRIAGGTRFSRATQLRSTSARRPMGTGRRLSAATGASAAATSCAATESFTRGRRCARHYRGTCRPRRPRHLARSGRAARTHCRLASGSRRAALPAAAAGSRRRRHLAARQPAPAARRLHRRGGQGARPAGPQPRSFTSSATSMASSRSRHSSSPTPATTRAKSTTSSCCSRALNRLPRSLPTGARRRTWWRAILSSVTTATT